MKGGELSYTLSISNETGTVVIDYTKITGNFVDICAELEAALDGGEGEGEEEVETALKGDMEVEKKIPVQIFLKGRIARKMVTVGGKVLTDVFQCQLRGIKLVLFGM